MPQATLRGSARRALAAAVRSRAAGVLLLATAVIVVAGGLLPISTGVAADSETCHLARLALANQEGFAFTDEDDFCRAERGDCHINDSGFVRNEVTCVIVVVSRYASPEVARSEMLAGGTALPLGEVGFEYDLLFEDLNVYDIEFQRGPFVVDVHSALLELGTPRTLAAQADAAINEYLTEGVAILPSPTPSNDRGDSVPGASGPRSLEDLAESIMVNAFVEDATLFEGAFKPFIDAVGKRSGCSIDTTRSPLHWFSGLETGPERCRATLARASQAAARLTEDARSDLGLDAGDLLQLPPGGMRAEAETVLAIWIANLEDADGQLLFPGVAASEQVIYILGRGGMVGGDQTLKAQTTLTRLLALTIGRDLLAWPTP